MNPALTEFQKSFTLEQKIAIIHNLLVVAQCDGEMHPKEVESMKLSARALGIEFDVNNLSPLMLTMFRQNNIPLLKTLSKNQKEWYIIAMHTLMHSDGKVLEKEVQYCLIIAEDIGISADEYKRILDKTDQIYNVFFK
jgi:uncharacterized tellurite resistance protein B-like protein